MSAQNNLDEIKKQLLTIKHHGGHISQYSEKLFDLFVDSYGNGFLGFDSTPKLTADAIMDYLGHDSEYQCSDNKTTYDLDHSFSMKWQYWTEAFENGLNKGYIKWS